MKYLLGIDIGSSSVKAALLHAESGIPVAGAYSPESEMTIMAPASGFAEQDPEQWWQELILAIRKLKAAHPFHPDEIIAIGISYQMHGLVCVDRTGMPLRPAIIWCDSRAAAIGEEAFHSLGEEYCLSHYLNSPGNFTASKLKWVKDNEPGLYEKIYKILLPGDFIALKMTGIPSTTESGLSEGIFWDYRQDGIADRLMDYYGLSKDLLADRVPGFGMQGQLSRQAGEALGLASGIPICYRAGDQPNNAWSVNVREPGEFAATAGTSGVIYGVTDKIMYDPESRVNSFIHVNHRQNNPRYGVLLCVNGTGILNSWVRKNFFPGMTYPDLNAAAATVDSGSGGLRFFPFGNGAERILVNRHPGASLQGLEFNLHDRNHVARAAQEGIAFALHYGWEIMQAMGMERRTIKAGKANMFLSDIFAGSLCNLTNCPIELYNTDGALGAARGAGLGAGFYASPQECFRGMKLLDGREPDPKERNKILAHYQDWKEKLAGIIN